MLRTIVSGGQSGADSAALAAATRAGLATDGWMPPGCMTEDGPRPDVAREFGLRVLPGDFDPRASYPERTRRNVALCDGLVWFGDPGSRGGRLTLRLAAERGLLTFAAPFEPRLLEESTRGSEAMTPDLLAYWLGANRFESVGVFGNRESAAPGIAAFVAAYLDAAFAEYRKIVGA